MCSLPKSYKGGAERTPPTKCGFCGEKQHGGGSRAEREKLCKAWGRQCSKCQRINHLPSVCKSASRPLKPTNPEEKTTTNAAFGFFGNSMTDGRASWRFPSPSTLPPCRAGRAIETFNRFESLPIEPASEDKGEDTYQPPKHHRGRVQHQPKMSPQSQFRETPTSPSLDMKWVPTTVAHLEAWKGTTQQSSTGTIRTVPLPHMVHDRLRNWVPANPSASPTCRLEYTLSRQSYSYLDLSMPMKKNKPVRKIVRDGVTDTGAQMNIVPVEVIKSMGISIPDLFPVRSKIGGPSAEPIAILGGVILQLKGMHGETGNTHTSHHLFYVASSCKNIYLSLDTCMAIGVVPPDFPKVGAFLEPDCQTAVNAAAAALPQGAGTTESPRLPPCSNTGTI